MRWYLAGPMTGIQDLNFPAFHAEAARLRAMGYDVVNPAELCPGETDWSACMRTDIVAMMACDGVALLPGWERSRGARIEFNLAVDLCLRACLASDITAASVSPEHA